MKIAFIGNFNKTIFFWKISEHLRYRGHEIFWITTSSKWMRWLLDKGVLQDQILHLKISEADSKKDSICLDLVSDIEKISGLKVKDAILMDRVVSKWDREKSVQYALYVITMVKNWIEKNNINVIFGETTWLHEILTSSIASYMNIYYLKPATIRLPSQRFAFFKGYLEKEIYIIYHPEIYLQLFEDAKKIANETRQELIKNHIKPFYWYNNSHISKPNLYYFLKILRKTYDALVYAKEDATIKSVKYQLKYEQSHLKFLRYYAEKLGRLFEKPKANEQFILYTLHKQPEASVDVLGSRVANQLELIRSIVKELPINIKLYVKEHPNALGERKLSYLFRIKRLPGVRLIDPWVPVHELIDKSIGVLTISGTVALEAAMLNKKAGIFTDMFFDDLSNVYRLDSTKDLQWFLEKKNLPWNYEDEEKMARIIMNSFPGIISDPISMPSVLDNENIINVVNGFEMVLNDIKRRKQK
ncbi:Capsule polysaccharide biosynthesis protein [Thermoanaerobacter mathranii subsp. mathranii str. A3]|jgi:hypothetical protein|uniref:UDP-N-acetylglucosamine 2-epimerase n=2 Tax=Thermoanaerobacter TaxID=1754 RepID=M8CS20_THETY|nr:MULTISPECIES: UDP-N-acetyl glucosamine 2-epimerase [Thermoanaerobacter]ADH60465.1 Capsule polysaccharide biosynthesis protein [Thermoanaerobacter mathranii subsp. mathranii str. A3]EMT39985.1 UDP-N-acetylglucosamine 2-epimerase [Thermoanaerobacter thermohydrosulfuricus WC1]